MIMEVDLTFYEHLIMHQIVESDVGTKNVRNNFYRF